MNDDKNLEPSKEELELEQEAQKEVKDDEIREKMADEMGIDPDEQSELLDKLVEREKANRKSLYIAIKQKQTWRDKAKATSEKSEKSDKGKPQNGQDTPDISELVSKKVIEALEQRDLETLDVASELKEEIKKIASVKGISIREASADPYIQYLKEDLEKKKRLEDAIPTRGGAKGGSYKSSYDGSQPLNASDFDLSTEDGRKAWEKATAARRKYKASQ